MYPENKINEILDYLQYSMEFLNKDFNRVAYKKELESLKCLQDIKNSPLLSQWESSIIYNLSGLDELKAEGKKIINTKTYLMIHPLFKDFSGLIESELKTDLSNKNARVNRKCIYTFSKELIVSLYGGTPWFEPYSKICTDMNCFQQISICFQIISTTDADCVHGLVNFKNDFRVKYPNIEVKKVYSGCELPGKVNPFHTPDSIENKTHIKAIENAIIGESA